MKKILLLIITIISIISCDKSQANELLEQPQGAGLVKDWIGLQLQLIRSTTGVGHVAYSRHFAYTGVALYKALTGAQSKFGKFAIVSYKETKAADGKPLFAPAAMNAAIADMLRFFYTKPAQLASIDSLETLYVNKFETVVPPGFDLPASIQFGKNIATGVKEWSKTDGASTASIPYTPLGEGYWEPTAPAYAAAAVPGWGNNKTILNGSTINIYCPEPLSFSANPCSPFYAMVKDLQEVSKALTPEQKAIAYFWDDAPNGKYFTVFGHWFSILKQVLEQQPVSLPVAAKAYLQLAVSMNDAAIYCWKTKFTYNQLRPISYIRKYMNDASWTPLLTTPNHPEYLAAHATISSAAGLALGSVFGNNFHFTDHSYDDLGMQPRTFNGFEAAADEAGLSRLYGGIHYRYSVESGKLAGRAVGAKVDSILKLPTVFLLLDQ